MSKRNNIPSIALAAAEPGTSQHTVQGRGELTMCGHLAEEDLATDFAGVPHAAVRLSWGGRA